MASSSQIHEPDYGSGSNRDSLAETFVTSFFSVQGEVAKAVQKGLSTFFGLDGDLLSLQQTADDLLEKITQTTDAAARNALYLTLNDILDRMHDEQIRANQTWNIVDDQITGALADTESQWKKAEPYFRTKQKRSEKLTSSAAVPQADFRNKARKVVPVVPMKLTPIGGDIVRPSLIPKKPIMKTTSKLETSSSTRKRSSSGSPDQQRSRPEKKMKSSTGGAVRKADRKEEKPVKDREKKAANRLKKKRVIRGHTGQRKVKREDSEENSASEDSLSSDPPYRGPSDGLGGGKNGNGRHDPDEPRYCICRNVSYGQMVGCDKDGCVIEWFHFVCVGLKAKPRGKWYCPTCRDGDNSKVMKCRSGGVGGGEMSSDKVN